MVCTAAAIWVPRFFGGKSTPALEEPPAEYWESGATEPWDGSSFEVEPDGLDTQSSAWTAAPDSAAQSTPSAAAAPAPAGLDPDRLLNVARALRGETQAPVKLVEPGNDTLESVPPLSADELRQPIGLEVERLRDSFALNATMVGEEDPMALIEGQLVRVGDPIGDSGAILIAVEPRKVLCRLESTEFELSMHAFRARPAQSSSNYADFPEDTAFEPEQ